MNLYFFNLWIKVLAVLTVILSTSFTTKIYARNQIQIVGSSTTYPFTTIVAERFGKNTNFRTPVIESTGTGGGFKLFCSGIGLSYVDATGASRRIKSSEFETCIKNGVSMTEFVIGNDGLAFANQKYSHNMDISIAHIAAALSRNLPVGGKIIPNPNKTWADVDAYVSRSTGISKKGFPIIDIRVLVPPPTSGTRDAMSSLFMSAGHKKLGSYNVIGEENTGALREDGAAIEIGENDNLIIEKLSADSDLFGVFGYSFFDQNRDKVQSATIDGITFSFDNIASYKYPGARPLFIYLKREHLDVIPGLKDFFFEYINEKTMGQEGYLFSAGLVPLNESDFIKQKAKIGSYPAMNL